ncbi:MAG: glycosyltransferase family 2 protein [Anaerolineales bacterium]|nr:glycosyltransferase family 2 protein [Anaerolineales bacterium]
MKLSIIVPCYNEADNIQKLYDELLPVVEDMVINGWHDSSKEIHSAEVIFVDDGSQDETFSKLKNIFSGNNTSGVIFKFLKHETNLGLGAAIRTGFGKADGDIVVTVDSDGTYKFSEIPSFLSFLTPDVDIVTASPYHPDGGVVGVPANRLWLSKGSSFLYRILVDRHVYTYTCLFRAYRSDVIKNISFSSNGFLAGTEVLVKAILKGYRVAEFPAVLHSRMYGVSKAKIAQTIFSHLRFQGRILLYRLLSMFGHKPKQTI